MNEQMKSQSGKCFPVGLWTPQGTQELGTSQLFKETSAAVAGAPRGGVVMSCTEAHPHTHCQSETETQVLPTNWFATLTAGHGRGRNQESLPLRALTPSYVLTSSTHLPASVTTRSSSRTRMTQCFTRPSTVSKPSQSDGSREHPGNPKLKILLCIGGYLFGSKGFHPMVDSSTSRLEFINSVILFLRNHNFDGLDISWIYPDVKDNTRFTVLIRELAKAFQQDFVKSTKERLLLTAAVSAGRQIIDNSYQIKKLAKELDFINLMSFDFHGSWEKPLVTGHNSPLRKGRLDRRASSYYNVEYAVGYWINKGMPAEKIVMGIPMYGRSFTLASAETTLGAPASAPGAAGPITKSSGLLAYYEVPGTFLCPQLPPSLDRVFSFNLTIIK
ncbi:chitinase-3-like protein 2 isoform X1 [Hippopotamus amphibius kiboko]|uniref:chitinase-3-like protein 2 isoform X1 n=1 Tax=Hippopotamus amphibius kiboko TaxID=575201 RepID=UPI0025965600|nr:chitinase-3-like protein 2 isoform X1 [Hippopotamus amphibius kiboko]